MLEPSKNMPMPSQLAFANQTIFDKCAVDVDLNDHAIAQLIADECFDAVIETLARRKTKIKPKTKKQDYIRERTNKIADVYKRVTESGRRARFLESLEKQMEGILPIDCTSQGKPRVKLESAFADINLEFKKLIENPNTRLIDIEKFLSNTWYTAVQTAQQNKGTQAKTRIKRKKMA